MGKFGQKAQADRPLPGRPAWHLQTHAPGIEPVAIWHHEEALCQGLSLDSIRQVEKPQDSSKSPQDSPRQQRLREPTSLEKAHKQSKASAKFEAETSQREAGRATVTPTENQLSTASLEGIRATVRRSALRGNIPRLAGLGEAGRPHFAVSQAPASCGS